jgi:hypothetical protein
MNTRIRKLIIGLIAASSFATATIAPAVSLAAPAAPVTCDGGGKPGDIVTIVTTVTVNGKVTGTVTEKKICGSDGNWHTMVAFEGPKETRPPVVSKGIGILPTTAAPQGVGEVTRAAPA